MLCCCGKYRSGGRKPALSLAISFCMECEFQSLLKPWHNVLGNTRTSRNERLLFFVSFILEFSRRKIQ